MVVEPPKPIKGGLSKVKKRKIFGYQTYDLGSIMQGLDEEDLEKLLQHHP
jgi:hypothetical protein